MMQEVQTGVANSGWLVPAIAALCGGGGVSAIFQWLSRRGTASAEAADLWTKATTSRIKAMHEEVTELEQRMRALNAELEAERKARLELALQLQRALDLLSRNGIEWDQHQPHEPRSTQ